MEDLQEGLYRYLLQGDGGVGEAAGDDITE